MGGQVGRESGGEKAGGQPKRTAQDRWNGGFLESQKAGSTQRGAGDGPGA